MSDKLYSRSSDQANIDAIKSKIELSERVSDIEYQIRQDREAHEIGEKRSIAMLVGSILMLGLIISLMVNVK